MDPAYPQIMDALASNWHILAGLCLLGAVLALDETAFAQTWLSQPLPAGVLAGLVAGDPAGGAAIGLPLQLVTLGNLPVGQFFTGERVTPLLGAVAAATLHGCRGWDPSILVPPVSDPRPGALLLAIVIGSILGNRLVARERRLHAGLVAGGLLRLKAGDVGSLERAHRICLLLTGVRGFLGTAFWTLVFAFVWLPLIPLVPGTLLRALGLLPILMPAVAMGTLIELRGPGSALAWMSLGFILVFVLGLISGGVV